MDQPPTRDVPEFGRDDLRLQLLAVDAVPVLTDLPHAHAIAPGLVEVVTVDLPDAVMLPLLEHLAHLGEPADVVEAAREGLHRLLADVGGAIEVRDITAEEGLTFTALLGESHHVASLAIFLPEVLEAAGAPPVGEAGVLLALPNRHHLAFRVLDDMPSLLAAGPLAGFARGGYEDEGTGPVSPHVHWVHGPGLTEWDVITVQSEDGITIEVPPELSALIRP